MSLPTHAEPDETGYADYPAALRRVRVSELLHVGSPDPWGHPLCGIGGTEPVEYIGRRRPVCRKCRRAAYKGKD